MRIAVERDPIRSTFDDARERAVKADYVLLRQAIDQVDVDRPEAQPPRLRNGIAGLPLVLNSMDRSLHLGIEVLNTEAQPIEAQLAQQLQCARAQRARVDFDGVLARVVQPE